MNATPCIPILGCNQESYRMLGGRMKSWVTEASTAVADRLPV